MVSYFERLLCQGKTIHEHTRSGRVLLVRFRVISWIVLVHGQREHETKLGDYPSTMKLAVTNFSGTISHQFSSGRDRISQGMFWR